MLICVHSSYFSSGVDIVDLRRFRIAARNLRIYRDLSFVTVIVIMPICADFVTSREICANCNKQDPWLLVREVREMW